MNLNRREFCRASLAAGTFGLPAVSFCAALEQETDQNSTTPSPFKLNYIVASCMYGTASLSEILPEVHKTGARHIELWAKPHGSQREEVDELGVEAVDELLRSHDVQLGSMTCFKYGIFNMQSEMQLAQRLGGDLVICNSGGPKNLSGPELKREVRKFAEKLKPHLDVAGEHGIRVGIENHSGGLINTPASIRFLFELVDHAACGLAMAPYHLPQDPSVIAKLIEGLDDRLLHIQAWEHGMGCMTKLPKEQELLQLPHRGPLDWNPILQALKKIDYTGRTEIFMHPVPRGIPILPEISQVTAEINAARKYLDQTVQQLS